MAETEAEIGWGGRVYLQDAADTWIELEQVTDVPYPDDQVADVESTHMQSPDRRKEYIPGLIDGGTGDIVMNWLPASTTDVTCTEFKNSGDVRGLRVDTLLSDGSYWRSEVSVIAKGYKKATPIEGVKKATLTVRFTGAAAESATS
jgi:hypothetical protein